jgi:hypothetical protein
MTNRYSRLADAAMTWTTERHRPEQERRQAMAIVSISKMLHERRFPHECEVEVLRLLVCKLCSESGEGSRCLSESPRNFCPIPVDAAAVASAGG